MYVGNLESYQGIDLLLDAFARLLAKTGRAKLVIVGGISRHIRRYEARVDALGIAKKVYFLGPKSADLLGSLTADADVLVSPRTKGGNTPMKIYSYLHSGKPVLATDLPTHTQVLNADVALLAPPEPDAFAAGMLRLIDDADLRRDLGQRGRRLIEEKYSFAVFRKTLNELYDWIAAELAERR
ncbi:MAG: glycosyltransferase family 4 protein [Kiritimatiellae bacterium]|nr:glycosyltransferase family 4 protein [Kiritimatiellia bacterium]